LRELLGEAGISRGAARAARTIIARRGLRMALIALRNGHQLAPHDSPGAATLLVVVEGRVLLRATDSAWRIAAHDIVAVVPQRRSLLAETDAVVLLTVRLD
jgi:quercetin dioxygenase-like cupin family protein